MLLLVSRVQWDKRFLFQISRAPLQWEPSSFMKADKTDGGAGFTKLTGDFRDVVNEPKNWLYVNLLQIIWLVIHRILISSLKQTK